MNIQDLSPRVYKDALVTVLDDYMVKGLTQEEGVALACRENVGSNYYQKLLDGGNGFSEYELALLKSEDLKVIVEMYAADEEKLLAMFSTAWTKMMTADRFANNRENACTNASHQTKEGNDKNTAAIISGSVIGAVALVVILGLAIWYKNKNQEQQTAKYATDSDKEELGGDSASDNDEAEG